MMTQAWPSMLSIMISGGSILFAFGMSSCLLKSNSVLSYRNHSQNRMVYSLSWKLMSCTLMTYAPTLTVSGFAAEWVADSANKRQSINLFTVLSGRYIVDVQYNEN